MRQFFSLPNGLERLVMEDISFLSDNDNELVYNLAIALGGVNKNDRYNGFIIRGFTPLLVSGTLWSVSDGVAFLNGELLIFPGGTINVPAGKVICIQAATIDYQDPRPFLDGTNNVIWKDRVAQLVIADPTEVEDAASPNYGGTKFPVTGITLYDIQRSNVLGVQNSWLNIGAAGAPAFQNSFSNISTGYPSSFGKNAAFRKRLNAVQLRGYVTRTALISAKVTIFQLPAGFRPAEAFVRPMVGACGQAFILEVDTAGNVSVQPTTLTSPANPVRVCLDSVQFDTI